LGKGGRKHIEYRLVIDGKPVYHSLRMIHGGGGNEDYFILGVQNIDKEYRVRQEAIRMEKENEVFNRIAEGLAYHYDRLFYVDIESGRFSELAGMKTMERLFDKDSGDDFYALYEKSFRNIVYEEDRDRMEVFAGKDYLLSALSDQKICTTAFRYYDEKKNIHHCRVSVVLSYDRTHFIVGFSRIDEEVRKEKDHIQALNLANEMARRDELTGIKNKTAYHEMEEEFAEQIRNGFCEPFAVVVCDINDLKLINDKKGHKAGDEYIRAACRMICGVFSHSPVFRIGGDEFVVVLTGIDFSDRDELLNDIRTQVIGNINMGEGPILAAGMSEFINGTDHKVSEVFERADSLMYENKNDLKEKKILKDSYIQKDKEIILIPEDRKKKLDTLFKMISVVAEGTYVYLCDMKYDFSRWSKTAVETFGLPSEYMYQAGDLWEERIHPDDREGYHIGITDIFLGNSMGHDMQYRARRVNGKYDVCTCRGFVVKDLNGDPDYFAGTIRNHGAQGNVDTLTGLRNQYGFFDDLQNHISANKQFNICMVGINKFSEVNEVYGYHFGNEVLQKFSRQLFEYVGNNGIVYRLDGTRFAVVSTIITAREVMVEYEKFRYYFRGKFMVGDRVIPLELSGASITVDSFDIDYQTIYSCLCFAYDESKKRRKGDFVEFYNDLNSDNRNRIEKLHEIRASITNDFAGYYLLYQPVVNAATEKVIGAEALLRWKNDKYGIVPPNHFIPLLELDPLFPDLGNWILKTAMLDAKNILEDYPNFYIHVNLAYPQIEKPDFVDVVCSLLDETGFPPERLVLEITERCRLLDIGLLKNVVVNLRGKGVLIALDDFGTGFSSVGLMKDLHVDMIKIDRGFVSGIEENENERKLVKSITSLASTFDAQVCVEGVETVGMRDILRNYSVQGFQGYFYAKPLPLEELEKYVLK
jgi:diguanylate cyclase (GGDEF)-like protein